jgi:hypothetical protein
MPTPDLLDRVAALDVAALCDADKDIRVMDPGLRPMLNLAEHCDARGQGRPSRMRLQP